ncbi:MAG: clan AA aspartic protease [Scytonematopsis contorta HA4267-MV1]|jgi:predicted aspartyl protease|nr:clan AA aspartic protease [Scytonematopsis contorta HA4267-MV1]
MIIGRVNAEYEATIRLSVYGVDGQIHEQTAIIDTGFNGWLSLPANLISTLELQWDGRGRATLGDGSECLFNIYSATVVWGEQTITIQIDEAESELGLWTKS